MEESKKHRVGVKAIAGQAIHKTKEDRKQKVENIRKLKRSGKQMKRRLLSTFMQEDGKVMSSTSLQEDWEAPTISNASIKRMKMILSCEMNENVHGKMRDHKIPSRMIHALTSSSIGITKEEKDRTRNILFCLANLATISEYTQNFVLLVPFLHTLLTNTSSSCTDDNTSQCCEFAMWLIGNASADNVPFRDAIILQILPTIITKLHEHEGVATTAWALSNLARGSGKAVPFLQAGILSPLCLLLQKKVENICKEIGWILCFLTAKEDEFVDQLLAMPGALSLIVGNMKSKEDDLSIPFLRILGNISAGKLEWGQKLLTELYFLENVVMTLHDETASS